MDKADTLKGTKKFFALRDALEKTASADNGQKQKQLLSIAEQFYLIDSQYYFKRASLLAYKDALKVKDSKSIVRANVYLGKHYESTDKIDSAFYFYTKAEKYSLKLNDSSSLASININKAFIQLAQSDFYGCELSASKALNYTNKLTAKRKQYDAFNLIGICASEMQNYERAIDYYNRALEIANDPSMQDEAHLSAHTLNNIGVVFQEKNNHLEALKYFKVALKENKLYEDSPSLYSISLDNYAYSKFRTGDYTDVEETLKRALAIRRQLGLKSGIVVSNLHLAEYFLVVKDSSKALYYANNALKEAQSSRVPADLLASLKFIAAIDKKNEALYSKNYITINDSIQKEERKLQDKFARIQFETNELNEERNKLEEQNRTLLYFFTGFLLIGGLLFIIRMQRAKNRELLLKQAQQHANEEIYNLMIAQQHAIEESRVKEKKRIAQELHDGILGRLFGTRLNLDSLNRLSDEFSVNKRIEYLTQLKNIEQDIREISHDLSREKFAIVNNFLSLLNNLIDDQEEIYQTPVVAAIDENIVWDEFSNAIKINIYRIVQECFQNINKYAKATEITLTIEKVGDKFFMKIIDNGVGFDMTQKKKGIGFQNINSRATEMNGSFELISKIGVGTTIIVHFSNV